MHSKWPILQVHIYRNAWESSDRSAQLPAAAVATAALTIDANWPYWHCGEEREGEREREKEGAFVCVHSNLQPLWLMKVSLVRDQCRPVLVIVVSFRHPPLHWTIDNRQQVSVLCECVHVPATVISASGQLVANRCRSVGSTESALVIFFLSTK